MHIKPLIVPVVASDAKHDLVLLKVGANFKRFATFREGAIQNGNSGGPLLDLSGHVIGVVVSKLDALKLARATGDIPQNVNFAIKGDVARKFMAAHDVAVVVAQSTAELSPADIAECAQLYTALIECWK